MSRGRRGKGGSEGVLRKVKAFLSKNMGEGGKGDDEEGKGGKGRRR